MIWLYENHSIQIFNWLLASQPKPIQSTYKCNRSSVQSHRVPFYTYYHCTFSFKTIKAYCWRKLESEHILRAGIFSHKIFVHGCHIATIQNRIVNEICCNLCKILKCSSLRLNAYCFYKMSKEIRFSDVAPEKSGKYTIWNIHWTILIIEFRRIFKQCNLLHIYLVSCLRRYHETRWSRILFVHFLWPNVENTNARTHTHTIQPSLNSQRKEKECAHAFPYVRYTTHCIIISECKLFNLWICNRHELQEWKTFFSQLCYKFWNPLHNSDSIASHACIFIYVWWMM